MAPCSIHVFPRVAHPRPVLDDQQLAGANLPQGDMPGGAVGLLGIGEEIPARVAAKVASEGHVEAHLLADGPERVEPAGAAQEIKRPRQRRSDEDEP
jgi:hypothetical protein